MPSLTMAQVYRVARESGFSPSVAASMTAIAWKESGGQTQAYNGEGPDDSYGLWQINMIDRPGYELGKERLQQFGLTSKDQLFDPLVNARAAYLLWAGNNANLHRHWAIQDGGINQARYQQYLPLAQNVMAVVEGAGSSGVDPSIFDNLDPALIGAPDEGWTQYSSTLVVFLVLGTVTAVLWDS